MRNGPKVLFLDIETAPILAYVWQLWDQNVGLNQIQSDWYVLSWSAKWRGQSRVMYQDQRKSKNLENDRKILRHIWALIDDADVIVTQNGKNFDIKKLNARFAIHGFKPPSPFKHFDTCEIAKKRFGFTSNKLEYLTSKLCIKKKSEHKKFPGFELWRACLSGDRSAWREMESYNKQDVLALEELFDKLSPWDSAINFSLWNDDDSTEHTCRCGSKEHERRGYAYTAQGKFAQYYCKSCGAWTRGKQNLLTTAKRKSLKVAA